MTRRDLIQKIVVGGAVILVTPTILSDCKKITTPVQTNNPSPGGGTPAGNITLDLTKAAYSALNTAGGSMVIQDIIIANTGGGGYVALSSVCTHQGCTVGFNPAANNFPCPCHGSLFSSSGSVINGPASSPLKSYAVTKAGNVLTITL